MLQERTKKLVAERNNKFFFLNGTIERDKKFIVLFNGVSNFIWNLINSIFQRFPTSQYWDILRDKKMTIGYNIIYSIR